MMVRLEPGDVSITAFCLIRFDEAKPHKCMHLVTVAPNIFVQLLDFADIVVSLVLHHPGICLQPP